MTPQGALLELLERLGAQQGESVRVSHDELSGWPAEAVAAMKSARLLVKARQASSIVCPGCERECTKPVDLLPAANRRPAQASIVCDEPEDLGHIEVEPAALEQWQVTGNTLAGAVARLLGFTKPPQADHTGKNWPLGLLPGREKGAVTFSIENGATLALAGQGIPLTHVLTLESGELRADRDALLRVVDGDAQEPASGIGSKAWRKQKAQTAAKAKHSKPGGSYDKQERMRAAWASGKYTSRDRCAEEECAALGISISTARKALRNTPDPKRT